jgi:hypothetical protein
VPQVKVTGLSSQLGGCELQQGEPSKPHHTPQPSMLQSPKERGTDERFYTFFHQDWYRSVLYQKTSPMVKHQFVHNDYMRAKKDMHFNKILEACDFHEITELLQFKHNWNQEVIAEFYSTLFYDKKERIFMWMTNGRRFNMKLSHFS